MTCALLRIQGGTEKQSARGPLVRTLARARLERGLLFLVGEG